MRKRFLLVIGAIILLIAVLSVIRYINAKNRSERMYYSRAAGIPSFAECIEEHGPEPRNGSCVFLQTRKFRSIGDLCANLPAGFSDAIKDALSSGVSQNGFDLKNKQVTIYEINPDLLPLEEEGSDTETDCHYCVFEYPDNTYRFALIIAIQYTR